MSISGHVLKTMFTGKDNTSYDLVRVLTAFTVVMYVTYTGYIVYISGIFNMIDFGIGYTGIMSSAGLAIKLKENSEPTK